MAGLRAASDDAVQQVVGPEGAKQGSHRSLSAVCGPVNSIVIALGKARCILKGERSCREKR